VSNLAMILFLILFAGAPASQSKIAAELLKNTPPDAAGMNEVPIRAITDKAVSRCVYRFEHHMAPKTGMRIVHFTATFSPKFGQIWRADASSEDKPPIVFRYVCTAKMATVRPLEMFDPKQSIPPLR